MVALGQLWRTSPSSRQIDFLTAVPILIPGQRRRQQTVAVRAEGVASDAEIGLLERPRQFVQQGVALHAAVLACEGDRLAELMDMLSGHRQKIVRRLRRQQKQLVVHFGEWTAHKLVEPDEVPEYLHVQVVVWR